MKSLLSPGQVWIKVIRSIARFLGLLFILITLFFFIAGEVLRDQPRKAPLPIIPLLLGALLLIGLGLAWKWELFGALLSLFAFIAISIINTHVLTKPLWYIFAIDAIFFLICWWWSKHLSHLKNRKTEPV